MRWAFRCPVIGILGVVLCVAARAPAKVWPASQPASRPAAGAGTPAALEQAVVLMRAGDFPKAKAVLEPLYAATPARQRSRPLVIDHAILDMTQQVYAARAVKDLLEYFAAHPENDEAALTT